MRRRVLRRGVRLGSQRADAFTPTVPRRLHRGVIIHVVVPALLEHPASRRGQGEQDLQRPAAALVGSAVRVQRDQPARRGSRIVHHAGEDQPGDPGGDEPGVFPGDRHRPHHRVRVRGGAAPAQRVRAHHHLQPPQQHEPDGTRAQHASYQVHRRHHGQPRAMQGTGG